MVCRTSPFIEGPEGLIVIDTGECDEEMAAALVAIREETSAPLAACIYTHFHYVGGTQALLAEKPICRYGAMRVFRQIWIVLAVKLRLG